MTISVRDAHDTQADRRWIQGVYRDYLDDLAPGTGTFPVLGEIGHREHDQFSPWFGSPNCFPLIILRSAQPVGFALIVREGLGRGSHAGAPVQSPSRAAAQFRMAEFFVVRALRCLGIGSTAVKLIFSRFTGRWEITAHCANTGAIDFWRRVVAGYTQGKYRERIVNGEVRQTFETVGPRDPAI